MPKPALNNRNNRINVYGRVIAHDIFVNQGVSNNDSPTFASLFLTGDATIAGNLYVEGNTAILNTNVIEFEDNIIVINSKETGNGVTLNQAGFEIERGSLENYRFAFRESDLNFRIGLVNNMQSVATREDNPLLNGIMIWNQLQKRLDSTNTIDIPTLTFQSTINSSSTSTGSLILSGGIGIKKDIFTDGTIYLGGTVYNKRSSIYTNKPSNNLVINSNEEINLIPRTNLTIPTNIPFILGDSNKFIKSTLSNNIDITCDGDINLNLGFSKRLVIPNLSSIVFSTDNEKIFTDGFNNMVIQSSEDILLQPLTNKKILIPNDIPIAFSNTLQQIKSNGSNDLLLNAGRNIVLTPSNSIRINSTVQSNSITSGGVILTGGMGMTGNLNIGGNLSVVGNLNILGTTTTINTETLLVKDNLIVLNNTPSALGDGGLLIKRFVTGTSGSINYAGIFYKEDKDEFTFALTNSDPGVGPVSITDYIPISVKYISASGSSNTIGNLFTTGENIGINTSVPDATLHINSSNTFGQLYLSNSVQNRKLVLWDSSGKNEHQWFGLGINDSVLRFQINNESDSYRFYSGTSSTSSNELMVISGNGNVGIGTTSPQAILEIKGKDNNLIAQFNTNGNVIIGNNLKVTGPILELPSGDTSSRPLNPSQGSIRYNSEYLQFEGYGAGDNWGSLGGVSDIAQTTKILAEEIPGTTDGNLYFYNIGVESMRINSSGNIGIGTTSPSSKLTVNGNTNLTQNVTAGSLNISSSGGNALIVEGETNIKKNLFIGGPALKIPSGDTLARPNDPIRGYIRFNTETEQFEGYGAGDTWGSLGGVIDTNQDTKILAEESPGTNDDNLRFFNNGSETMRINNIGYVGIGTTQPQAVLDVRVEGDQGNLIAQFGSNSGTTIPRFLFYDQTFPGNAGPKLLFNAGNIGTIEGIGNLAILPSSNLGIGTTNPTSKLHVDGDIFATGEVTVLSDVRFKTNIQTIDNALEKVDKIRGVYFNRKLANGGCSSRNVGVIADEVEKVLPEVVYLQDNIKSVAYHNIIGLLIEAVKELKTEINQIKQKQI